MAEMKFDQALKELEKLVEEMEGEELSLEDGLKKYEKGMKLSQICLEKLERAEKKIEILKQPAGDNPETEPFVGSKNEEGIPFE
jgi:exodeoxyribonuclease VII small subunit